MTELIAPLTSWDDYQQRALSTALRPILGKPWVYPLIGLAGESGELSEKIDELALGKLRLSDVAPELGDVYWYVAMLAYELGMTLGEVAKECGGEGALDARGNGGSGCPLAGRISAAQGKVAELLKKSARDAGGEIDDERAAKLVVAMGGVLGACNQMASFLGESPRQIMYGNVVKLASRKQRGQIQGDGDNR